MSGHPAPPTPSAVSTAGGPSPARRLSTTTARLAPGIAVSLAAALVAFGISRMLPGVSALLVAILLGALWCNLLPVPQPLQPGTAFTARHLLRTGIVLLGLSLSLGALTALGPGVLLLVVAAVGITFTVTVLLGRWLRIPTELTLLVASGFSICGAAAVGGAAGVLRARQEHVAAALGLVVLFGTLMIPALPLLVTWLGLGEVAGGIWAGASVHEVAQSVAAAGLIGGGALSVAVTVKLARVLMLAPVMAVLAWRVRRTAAAEASTARAADREGGRPTMPPLVPAFVLGFLAMVLLRSTGVVPEPLLVAASVAQNVLLAAAMFALGLGVRLRTLIQVGPRPALLGLVATLAIVGIGGAGAVLLG